MRLHCNSCQAIISHAGIGNISLAMKMKKPLLVVPRRKQYGEVVNDHQVDTARKFGELGHILVAYEIQELPEKINQLKTFVPALRCPNREGIFNHIVRFLEEKK